MNAEQRRFHQLLRQVADAYDSDLQVIRAQTAQMRTELAVATSERDALGKQLESLRFGTRRPSPRNKVAPQFDTNLTSSTQPVDVASDEPDLMYDGQDHGSIDGPYDCVHKASVVPFAIDTRHLVLPQGPTNTVVVTNGGPSGGGGAKKSPRAAGDDSTSIAHVASEASNAVGFGDLPIPWEPLPTESEAANGKNDMAQEKSAKVTVEDPCNTEASSRRDTQYSKPTSVARVMDDDEEMGDAFAVFKGWVRDGGMDRRKSERRELTRFQYIVHTAVHTQCFDAVCALMIVGSAAMLGLQVNYAADRQQDPDDLPDLFGVANRIFTIYFLLELYFRYLAEGCGEFVCGKERGWNLFDAVVVSSDVIDTLYGLIAGSGGGQSQTRVLRVLRVARITRAIRVVRMVRFFRELRMMVYSVLMSGGSLVWSMLLFFIIIYMFGMYFCQMVVYHLSDINFQPDGHLGEHDIKVLLFRWGNLANCWYTLFLSMTGGVSWGEVVNPLILIHWSHSLAMILFMFFTIFVVTNIITGIFVDTAIQSAQSDREQVIQDQLHEHNSSVKLMKEIFREADTDNTGDITLQEFEDHLKNKEVLAHLKSIGLDFDEALGLFKLLDTDGSFAVGIDEFVSGCMRLKGGAKSIDLATLMYENKRLMEKFENFFLFVKENFHKIQAFQLRVETRFADLSDRQPPPRPAPLAEGAGRMMNAHFQKPAMPSKGSPAAI